MTTFHAQLSKKTVALDVEEETGAYRVLARFFGELADGRDPYDSPDISEAMVDHSFSVSVSE